MANDDLVESTVRIGAVDNIGPIMDDRMFQTVRRPAGRCDEQIDRCRRRCCAVRSSV